MAHGRRSTSIHRKPASNLYHAVRIAERVGADLTHFVTINFSLFGCVDEDVSVKFRWVRARWGDWMRRPSRRQSHKPAPAADTWSIEAKGGVTAVHWMVHLPDGRIEDFKARLAGWIAKLANGEFPENAINIKPIRSARGLASYLLKGIDPPYASKYGVKPEDQGVVFDKRSGYSRLLGPTVKSQMREEGTYPRVGAWAKYSDQHVRRGA